MKDYNLFSKKEKQEAIRFAEAMGLDLHNKTVANSEKSDAVRFAEAMGLRHMEKAPGKNAEKKKNRFHGLLRRSPSYS